MEPEPVNDDTEKQGGLEPETFQRRLIIVTVTVLVLGVVGGTCLGLKINRAEQYQARHDEAPSEDHRADHHKTPRQNR